MTVLGRVGASRPARRLSRYGESLLYTAFTLSGAAGLIYEVMWARSFSLVFGSTAKAAAAVLAAFFTGLAVGGFVGVRLARHRAAAELRYAVAEGAIVVTALLVGVWLAAFERWYPALYQSPLGGGWTMAGLELLLAFVALAPPSAAMGVTLPLMARALVSREGHVGRRVSLAYALNTVGATGGVVLAGFVLPPLFGANGTIWLAVALNLAAAGLAVAAWRTVGAARAAERPGTPRAAGIVPSPAILVVVAVSGFGTLALEVLYTRLIVNLTDSSVFSFSLMLATFLVCLALASLIVSVVVDRLANPWALLAWTLSLGALAILVSPTVLRLMAPWTQSPTASLAVYLLRLEVLTAVTIGPVVVLIGAALPTAWKIATRHAAESGRRVGFLTGVNTLAAVLGSVAAGFVLIPALGIGNSVALVAALYAGLALLAWAIAVERGAWLYAGLALAGLFVALYSLGTWRTAMFVVGPRESVVYYREGESANVAVLKSAEGILLLKVNNRYLLGSSDSKAVDFQRGQGGLPLLLHADPQSVAFIGVGTGISVGAVLDFPVRRVVALELIRGVTDAAVLFNDHNRGVLGDPRVETMIADGRNHLYATDERFDVIVSDLFVPWHAGTGYLYTAEHFETVARRLNPGGIFAQWLPGHQLTVEELRMISATFLDAFESTTLWVNDSVPRTPLVALVGRLGAKPVSGDRRAAIESSEAFPDLNYICDAATLGEWAATAPRNTDKRPRLEFAAAASHFTRPDRTLREVLRVIEILRQARDMPGMAGIRDRSGTADTPDAAGSRPGR